MNTKLSEYLDRHHSNNLKKWELATNFYIYSLGAVFTIGIFIGTLIRHYSVANSNLISYLFMLHVGFALVYAFILRNLYKKYKKHSEEEWKNYVIIEDLRITENINAALGKTNYRP